MVKSGERHTLRSKSDCALFRTLSDLSNVIVLATVKTFKCIYDAMENLKLLILDSLP